MYQLTYHYTASVFESRRAEAAEFRRTNALLGARTGRRYSRRHRSQARH